MTPAVIFDFTDWVGPFHLCISWQCEFCLVCVRPATFCIDTFAFGFYEMSLSALFLILPDHLYCFLWRAEQCFCFQAFVITELVNLCIALCVENFHFLEVYCVYFCDILALCLTDISSILVLNLSSLMLLLYGCMKFLVISRIILIVTARNHHHQSTVCECNIFIALVIRFQYLLWHECRWLFIVDFMVLFIFNVNITIIRYCFNIHSFLHFFGAVLVIFVTLFYFILGAFSKMWNDDGYCQVVQHCFQRQ